MNKKSVDRDTEFAPTKNIQTDKSNYWQLFYIYNGFPKTEIMHLNPLLLYSRRQVIQSHQRLADIRSYFKAQLQQNTGHQPKTM